MLARRAVGKGVRICRVQGKDEGVVEEGLEAEFAEGAIVIDLVWRRACAWKVSWRSGRLEEL